MAIHIRTVTVMEDGLAKTIEVDIVTDDGNKLAFGIAARYQHSIPDENRWEWRGASFQDAALSAIKQLRTRLDQAEAEMLRSGLLKPPTPWMDLKPRDLEDAGWRSTPRAEWTHDFFGERGGSGLCYSFGQAQLMEGFRRTR